MPSVKIPKKSTWTDMTPFVDVAFLILAFFMLATKFKPPAPAEITTPKSVSTDQLKETNSVMVEFDKTGRVFFSVNVKNPDFDTALKARVIRNLNTAKGLGLTDQHVANFVRNTVIGVSHKDLKAALEADPTTRYSKVQLTGIPTDSANNELADWVRAAKLVFIAKKQELRDAGDQEAYDDFETFYMIKGDNDAKYPQFDGVIEAMRRNDQFRFKLITDPEAAPTGTEFVRIEAYRKAAEAKKASEAPAKK